MVAQQQQQTNYDIALEMTQGGDFTLPDPDIYIIQFKDVIGTKDWPNDDGGVDVSLTLQFVVADPESEFDGVEFRDYFPQRVTLKNKSGKLWTALWGGELPDPLPRTSEFVGKKCRATLIHRAGSDGNAYAKIASVVPIKQKRPRVVEVEDLGDPGF